jgi:acyl carrier protein
MMPAAWMLLRQLPLTPNGKVDRRALPPPQSRPEELGEYVAPRDEIERALAEIWAQVLRLDQVGVQDNFFELGGHSLLATQVVVRVRSALSIEMPMRLMFQCPTVEQLAAQLRQLRESDAVEQIDGDDSEVEDLLDTIASMPESKVQELVRELRLR